jgi:hypothetical protein
VTRTAQILGTSATGAGGRLGPLLGGDMPVRRPVNIRSVLVGLLGVVLICGLTPYNDFVVNNTYVVGNFLSVGLLLFFMVLVTLVNAPLSRWAPRWAFSYGELATAMAMVAVSCGVPSSGLMRYLPSHIVGLWYHAGDNSDYMRVMLETRPVDWIFPSFASEDYARRFTDPVIQHFWTRAPVDEDTFLGHLRAIPWGAWVTPALTWGVMTAATFGALLCMLMIVRHQWVENERLPFPIAHVMLSVIEPPQRGRALSDLFRSRAFWIAFAAVFLAHGLNALHAYDPKWPEFPLNFDLRNFMRDPPLSYIEDSVKDSDVFFTVIGITFFLQTKVAFSLWAFYLITQMARIGYGTFQSEYTGNMLGDEIAGALIPYVAMIFWIGRRHWAMALGQMVRRPRQGEPSGRYLPYRALGWMLLICLGAMFAWLLAAKVTVMGALVIVAMVMMLFLVVARIVAETGLLFLQVSPGAYKPWQFLADVSGGSIHTTQRSFFMAGVVHAIYTGDQRESLAAYGTNALRVADVGAFDGAAESQDGASGWRRGAPMVAAIVGALVVAWFVAGFSTLYTSYSYAVTLDKTQIAPINDYGLGWHIKIHTMNPGTEYRPPTYFRPVSHGRWQHFGIGAGITTVCSILRLRYSWWPLHPVGFIVADSYAIDRIWFSILVGWLAKVVVVRFGGASMFRSARTLFIGLILGESFAAAWWLVVALVRSSLGERYEPVMLLPA